MESARNSIDDAAAATELYWGSDRSVNQIAEELNLSKSALYGLIRPLASGRGCPECGEEVVSPNRTARDRGILSCPVCGWEGDDDDANSYGGEGTVTLPTYDEVDAVATAPVDRRRNRTILGGAMLGAAAGLALVLWTRRGR